MGAQLIKLYDRNNSIEILDSIVQVLHKNGVIIYRTDTMYALGCLITSQQAIQRICDIKQIKPNKNRFSFICNDLSSIANYANVSDVNFKLLKHYLPGPYTFVLPASSNVPSVLVQGKKTVGVRIPDYSPILELIKELNAPLLTTTLAHEGLDVEEFTDPSLIFDRYKNQVDLVLDGGFGGIYPSSVIDLTDEIPVIIREGAGPCDDFI
jgi:tRNA threonylcarbamoyl adenosine modification protein (Sua5/YciO/YrdC/YwlC family)